MYEETEEIFEEYIGEMIGEMIGEEILEDMVGQRPSPEEATHAAGEKLQ